MGEYSITYPAVPDSGGVGLQARFMRVLAAQESNFGDLVNEVPIIRVDYRHFAVNTVFQRAFTYTFLKTGVTWIDDLLEREGFRRSFKDNMRRMLMTGEYFAFLGVRGGAIYIDRIPKDWVTRCAVYEKTGELLSFVYIEPILYLVDSKHRNAWKKYTWEQTKITIEISLEEDDPYDDEAYRVSSIKVNPYGFIPIVPFKLGTFARGVAIWKPAESVIQLLEDVINDIRLLNAYNASPTKWIKTDGEFTGLDETGFVQMGPADEIGALEFTGMGKSLFDEFVFNIGILSDLLGIPVTSILQVGKHASGEAIEKRLDTLTRMAKNLREYVGNQMQLMFQMFSAFIAMGLVEIDFSDPQVATLLTNQVVLQGSSFEQRMQAQAVYAKNIGTPVDLSRYTVPDVKWVPIEKIDPQNLLQLGQALSQLKEDNIISDAEARYILEMNLDHLVVATDLATVDDNETEAEKLGGRLNRPSERRQRFDRSQELKILVSS